MKSASAVAVLSVALASIYGAAADEIVRFQGDARESVVCRADGAGCSQFKGYVVVNPRRPRLAAPREDAAPTRGDYSAASATGEADFRMRRLYLGADAP